MRESRQRIGVCLGVGLVLCAVPLLTLGCSATPPVLARQTSVLDTPVSVRAIGQLTVSPHNPPTPTHNAQVLRQIKAMPGGGQLVERTFFSPTLGRQMPYFIYLPAGYADSTRQFPTLYMLHGRGAPGIGGSDTEWVAYGLPETSDRLMSTGEIPPMIIVMPQGDQSYWINQAGGARWGDYTATDVVGHIDATYRTVPDAAHRAIGGLSMGGHGSLQLAINYPDVFGAVGMHSPTLRTFEERFDYFGDAAFFAAHDPTALVRQYPERARTLRIFLDVGQQDDLWRKKVVAFRDVLTSLSVPHIFASWQGEHNAYYWGPHIPDYLRFYNGSFPPA